MNLTFGNFVAIFFITICAIFILNVIITSARIRKSRLKGKKQLGKYAEKPVPVNANVDLRCFDFLNDINFSMFRSGGFYYLSVDVKVEGAILKKEIKGKTIGDVLNETRKWYLSHYENIKKIKV